MRQVHKECSCGLMSLQKQVGDCLDGMVLAETNLWDRSGLLGRYRYMRVWTAELLLQSIRRGMGADIL